MTVHRDVCDCAVVDSWYDEMPATYDKHVQTSIIKDLPVKIKLVKQKYKKNATKIDN